MYIHLGNDVSVRTREIVGIFDMESTTVANDTRAFLANCEDSDCVTDVSPDLPKSFVLCSYDGSLQLYVSAVAAATLCKRASASQASLRDVGTWRRAREGSR